jgi:hypothetical protein
VRGSGRVGWGAGPLREEGRGGGGGVHDVVASMTYVQVAGLKIAKKNHRSVEFAGIVMFRFEKRAPPPACRPSAGAKSLRLQKP